jgi:hypothetical protein
MSDNFVGFAQSPKADPNRKVKTYETELTLNADLKSVFAAFNDPDFYEGVFDKLAKLDFRQGAKLTFEGETEYRGTFSRIDIPREIILLTELHGEVAFRFKERKGSIIKLKVKKALLEEEVSTWGAACEKIVATLGDRFGSH